MLSSTEESKVKGILDSVKQNAADAAEAAKDKAAGISDAAMDTAVENLIRSMTAAADRIKRSDRNDVIDDAELTVSVSVGVASISLSLPVRQLSEGYLEHCGE